MSQTASTAVDKGSPTRIDLGDESIRGITEEMLNRVRSDRKVGRVSGADDVCVAAAIYGDIAIEVVLVVTPFSPKEGCIEQRGTLRVEFCHKSVTISTVLPQWRILPTRGCCLTR